MLETPYTASFAPPDFVSRDMMKQHDISIERTKNIHNPSSNRPHMNLIARPPPPPRPAQHAVPRKLAALKVKDDRLRDLLLHACLERLVRGVDVEVVVALGRAAEREDVRVLRGRVSARMRGAAGENAPPSRVSCPRASCSARRRQRGCTARRTAAGTSRAARRTRRTRSPSSTL